MKYLVFITVLTLFSCSSSFFVEKNTPEFQFHPNVNLVVVGNDSIYHKSFNKTVYSKKTNSVFSSKGSFLYKTNLETLFIDSIQFEEIDSAIGMHLDEKRQIISFWQKTKDYIHYFLLRYDITSISYSEKIGVVFILSNFLKGSYTLSVYPAHYKSSEANNAFRKLERRIPIGNYSEIVETSDSWIKIKNPDTGDETMIYPYNN